MRGWLKGLFWFALMLLMFAIPWVQERRRKRQARRQEEATHHRRIDSW